LNLCDIWKYHGLLFAYFSEKISPRDLQRIDIPGIKTPKYATTVFLVKECGRKE
jgi:hypothetical protein